MEHAKGDVSPSAGMNAMFVVCALVYKGRCIYPPESYTTTSLSSDLIKCEEGCKHCTTNGCFELRTRYPQLSTTCPLGFEKEYVPINESDSKSASIMNCVYASRLGYLNNFIRCPPGCATCAENSIDAAPPYNKVITCYACYKTKYTILKGSLQKACVDRCPRGYGPRTVSDRLCVPCAAANCLRCDIMASHCEECQYEYSRFRRKGAVDECLDKKMSLGISEIGNVQQTFIDEDGRQLRWAMECSAMCLKCESPSKCVQCRQGYMLDVFGGCASHDPNSLSAAGQCSPECEFGCLKNNECVKCKHFSLYTMGQLVCVDHCPLNFYPDKGLFCMPDLDYAKPKVISDRDDDDRGADLKNVRQHLRTVPHSLARVFTIVCAVAVLASHIAAIAVAFWYSGFYNRAAGVPDLLG